QLAERVLSLIPWTNDDGCVVLLQRARVEPCLGLGDTNAPLGGKQFHHTPFLDLKNSNSDHPRPHPAAHPTCPKPLRLTISIRKKPGNGSSRWTRCSKCTARRERPFWLDGRMSSRAASATRL